jgi:SAM-dependent methyltransferase
MPRRLAQRLMESAAIARIYESRLWRGSPLVVAATGLTFAEEWALVERAASLPDAARVLDLACGPGLYARRFARRSPGARVFGLDLSKAMLAEARRSARAERAGSMFFVRGDARALPFRDAAFDVVNCGGALHLFGDLPGALREVARVLVAGGRFTFAAIRRGEGRADRVAAAFRWRFLGVDSFRASELERLLGEAGLFGFELLHEHGLWLVAIAAKRSA